MRPTLSVAMIVRNEQALLRDALQSASAWADQVVILDTGSSDQTVEIAEQGRATIGHHEWCDDFAAARNASIELCTGDWVIWLDADERLSTATAGMLTLPDFDPEVPQALWLEVRNLRLDGSLISRWNSLRIFPNDPGFRFAGRQHMRVCYAREDERPLDNAVIDGLWIDHLRCDRGGTNEGRRALGNLRKP